MAKNKSCPPTRRLGYYTLKYDTGIDYMTDLVEVAIRFGVINKAGSWFDIIDSNTGEIIEGKIHGQANVYEILNTNAEILEKVENLVEKVMQEN